MGKKSELDDLRARLATLEAEVDRLRGGAAATNATATATVATATVAAGRARERAESGSAPQRGHAPGPDAVRGEPADQPQSMTCIADVIGVMVSGRAAAEEQTRVLRARTEAPERRSAPRPEHGEFLEGLLSGRPALQK